MRVVPDLFDSSVPRVNISPHNDPVVCFGVRKQSSEDYHSLQVNRLSADIDQPKFFIFDRFCVIFIEPFDCLVLDVVKRLKVRLLFPAFDNLTNVFEPSYVTILD